MTRSELLERSIANARTAIFCQQHGDYEFPALQEVRKFTLDALLAEQKREEGCPVCRGEVVVKDYFGHRCVKISGHYMEVANAEEEYPWNTVEIKACPFCAKALTDGESE